MATSKPKKHFFFTKLCFSLSLFLSFVLNAILQVSGLFFQTALGYSANKHWRTVQLFIVISSIYSNISGLKMIFLSIVLCSNLFSLYFLQIAASVKRKRKCQKTGFYLLQPLTLPVVSLIYNCMLYHK